MTFNTDPDRSINELLADIQRGSLDTSSTQNANFIGSILSPFAALLVRLSRDAQTTAAAVNAKTQALIVLTRILIILTVILIFLTAPIVWVEVTAKLTEDRLHFPQNGNHANQSQENTNSTKKLNQVP